MFVYDPEAMVDRHYVPQRDKLLPSELAEVTGMAAAYRLGKDGLVALAQYMNEVARNGCRSVPPKARQVAENHATTKRETRTRWQEPSIVNPAAFFVGND